MDGRSKVTLDRMVVVRAHPSDAPDILALQLRAYASEAAHYGDQQIPPLVQTIDDLTAELATHLALKAVLDGRIVGSVRARRDGETARIGRLIVDPPQQGRGIGTLLMRKIEAALQGVARYELFTGHLSEGNLRLYHRLGYTASRQESVAPDLTLVFLDKCAAPGSLRNDGLS